MMDLMIDLETLGTNTKAPIISIGAVWFDPESGELGAKYYVTLDVAEQMDSRTRFADASTIKWWMQQDGAAKAVFREDAKPTKYALQNFRDWIMSTAGAGAKSKATKKCFPWGNGSCFDIVLLESIFKDYDIECPWLFYNVMDLRTFRRFVTGGAKVENAGTAHNALDDAVAQAEYVIKYSK